MMCHLVSEPGQSIYLRVTNNKNKCNMCFLYISSSCEDIPTGTHYSLSLFLSFFVTLSYLQSCVACNVPAVDVTSRFLTRPERHNKGGAVKRAQTAEIRNCQAPACAASMFNSERASLTFQLGSGGCCSSACACWVSFWRLSPHTEPVREKKEATEEWLRINLIHDPQWYVPNSC